MIHIVSYSIYQSSNSYLGIILAERALRDLPVSVERRPLYVPHERGVKVAELIGGREAPGKGSYHREDCARWAAKYGIELHYPSQELFDERVERWRRSPYGREELPARAYYASLGSGCEAALDRALFRAAYVEGLDVNEEAVVRQAAEVAGLDPDETMRRALMAAPKQQLEAALAGFDRDLCPGVPTWIVDGERYWGKDRVDWLVAKVQQMAQHLR